MKFFPKVSVIMPTYNRALLLKKAVESVLSQTFTDYEIIIIDDGSTDNTKEVIESFFCPKIKYIYQNNQGRSNARNEALKIAKGQYVAFLDSDDMFVPDKLEKQVSILDKERDYGMSYTSARVFDGNDNELFSRDRYGNKRLYYEAKDSGWIYDKVAFYLPLTIILPSVMVRSEIMSKIGGFDESLHRFEDTDTWRRIAKECKIFAISEPLCIIRAHSGNKMEHPKEVYASLNKYVAKIFDEDKEFGYIFKRKGAARLYYHYAHAVLFNKDYDRYHSIFFFVRSFAYWPPYAIAFTAAIIMRLGTACLHFVSYIMPESLKSPVKAVLVRLNMIEGKKD